MGPGVKPPTLAYKVEPEYSEEARAAKLQGTVLLKVVIDVDGLAKDIEVVNGQGLGLDEQAVAAIMRWKFNPGAEGRRTGSGDGDDRGQLQVVVEGGTPGREQSKRPGVRLRQGS